MLRFPIARPPTIIIDPVPYYGVNHLVLTRARFGTGSMTFVDIVARVERLECLSIGLSKEIFTWKECNDPLLYRERQDYLQGIRDAQSGIETARVALAHAKQRLAALTDGG